MWQAKQRKPVESAAVQTESQILYQRIIQKKIWVCGLLVLGTLFCFAFNLTLGSSEVALSDIVTVLLGGSVDPTTDTVVRSIRLPIAVMAILAGAAFAIGGCEMQTILGNPMASPYTLGISAAAAFGAAAGIILDLNLAFVPPNLVITANSFVFSLLASFMIYRFAARRSSGKNGIILFGIALNFIFNSLTMFLQYIADENKLQSLVFWSFGSLVKSS